MKSKLTKRETIKQALLAGKQITGLDAWRLCKTLTLPSIIRDLKKLGMKIKTEYKVTDEYRYAVYSLAKKKGAR